MYLGGAVTRKTKLSDFVEAKAREREREKREKEQREIEDREKIEADRISELARFEASCKSHAVHPMTKIIIVVCDVFGVTKNDIMAPRRAREYVNARQAAMVIAKAMTQLSFPEIGRRVGGRDHTTVLHAVRCFPKKMEADPELRKKIDLALEKLAELS